jgi:hypothetical protein
MILFIVCAAVVIAIVTGVAFLVVRPLLKGNRRTR